MDDDYVVVGATPEQMIALGFRAVGRDFPVFIHPRTGSEYALARTERKSGRGYGGFTFHTDPDVTLEEDLRRRDLTINAMARDEHGALIDPFGGERDLRAGVLRHVSPAFAEDPLRVLRAARFAARFAFRIAPETEALMRRIVASDELSDLVPERVWGELARGLMERRPSRMITALRECGALAQVLPEVEQLFGSRARPAPPSPPPAARTGDAGEHVLAALDYAADAGFELPARFAALVLRAGGAGSGAGSGAGGIGRGTIGALCARLRVPNECRDVALASAELRDSIADFDALAPNAMLDVLRRADALRRPRRLQLVLDACEADALGAGKVKGEAWPPRQAVLDARAVVAATPVDRLAAEHRGDATLPQRIREAQVAALARWRARRL